MKKVFFIAVVIFILSVAVGIFIWWSGVSSPVSTSTETVDFLVVKGRAASQIGEALYKEGLIKNPLAFKFYVQTTGKSDQIQAGEFRLSPAYSLEKTVDTLTGPPLELWVTVPEGLRREEIVERFVQGLEKEEPDASNFRQEFLEASEDMEGFLFPDTYLFPRDVKASSVTSAMRNTFDKRIAEIGGDKSPEFTLEDIVTLASIIERETKTDVERPVVAGILLNRLEIGMGLQADAATQYALANARCQKLDARCDNWWPILTLTDLQIDSPYNTYKYRGLPPAPIANPGLSSLKAAIDPAETDYLYYLHDSEGGIHYAETLDEHNANVKEYLGK